MPFKDTRKRAAYMREYRRRRNPELQVKCYICPTYPNMPVKHGVHFVNGFLVTYDPEIQTRVEAKEGYGKTIFAIKLDRRTKQTKKEL